MDKFAEIESPWQAPFFKLKVYCCTTSFYNTRFLLAKQYFNSATEIFKQIRKNYNPVMTTTATVVTYRQMHRTDNYSQHSSIICPVSLNGWVFFYEQSDCGFESRCCHLNSRYRTLTKELLDTQLAIECRFTLKRVRDMIIIFQYPFSLGNHL